MQSVYFTFRFDFLIKDLPLTVQFASQQHWLSVIDMYHFIPEDMQLVLPYLCESQDECSEEAFSEYPTRYGLDVDSIIARGSKFSTSELDNIAAILQAWLVFGLIRKLLGPSDIHVRLDDFVFYEDDNLEDPNASERTTSDRISESLPGDIDSTALRPIVSMHNISTYILYWIARECHVYNPQRRDELWAEHAAVFTMVNSVINKLIVWRKDSYPLADENKDALTIIDSLILSIVLLVEPMLDACRMLFTTLSWKIEWELDNALQWYLLNAGWCIGEVGS